MKRLAPLLPWLVGAIFLAAWIGAEGSFKDAIAESARLRATVDSLAAVTARVDTVTVERARTFTKWRDSVVTLRDSFTVTDTVEVLRVIAVQDSTITACVAVVSSCEEGKRLRDARIAALDSLNASTERTLRATERKATRDRLTWGVAGLALGRLLPR